LAITGGRDDLDDAVGARMARQRVLHHGNHRFHLLIGETALWRTVGDVDTMTEQLTYLLDALVN
jgi:hypothetical protein